MTIIENPDRELMFLIQAKHRLRLEIRSGLKFRGRKTTMGYVNEKYGTKFHRKPDALQFIEEKLEEYS